jgi:hypothetical protein
VAVTAQYMTAPAAIETTLKNIPISPICCLHPLLILTYRPKVDRDSQTSRSMMSVTPTAAASRVCGPSTLAKGKADEPKNEEDHGNDPERVYREPKSGEDECQE